MRIKTILIAILAFAAVANTEAQVKIKTDAGDLTLQINGRTNFDAGTYIVTSEDNLDQHNGVAMNDTRLGAIAKFDEKWSAKIEICYASKAISFRDLWIGYQLNANSSIKVGNHFQPYGAKPLGLAYKFVEDASADYAFCPARKIGASYSYTSDHLNVTAGLFSDGNVDGGKNVDKGVSAAAKVIYRPIIDDNTVLHLGVAPMFVQSPNEINHTGIIPTTVVSKSLITTGAMKNKNYLRMEVEALYIQNKIYAEAHYLANKMNDAVVDSTVNDVYLDGFYVQAGYMIKGDKQNYNKATGLTKSASPKSLEVLVRLSHLNFDDSAIKAGKQTDLTIGCNYFINKNLNVKLNYIYATVKDHDDYHMIQSRLQFSF